MISSAVIRHSVYSRAALTLVAFAFVAIVLGASLSHVAAQLVPSVACAAQPTVEYQTVYVGSTTTVYTADEAARRLNARAGYVVKRLRYAPDVHGVVSGRYAGVK